ncbi:MAG: GntR family transcriptional regulator [Verrucomicrobia bacterium]|nr:GntR family transcriptional regulator [Verrucomicrobiota bacterium]MCH8513583.1 GntR family transcriptional regulator [Kiritimatiellia bacterium]
MLPFSISFKPGIPPCDQLVDAVRKAVATGDLAHNTLFPSVRVLSRELKISPTTVHKAVSQLKQEGLLLGYPGVGMVVSARKATGLDHRLMLLQPFAETLAREARELNVSGEELMALVQRSLYASGEDGNEKHLAS